MFHCPPIWLERKGAPSISMDLKPTLCFVNFHSLANPVKNSASSAELRPFPSEMTVMQIFGLVEYAVSMLDVSAVFSSIYWESPSRALFCGFLRP